MAERILPQPDVFATGPPEDTSILEHYAGTFEAVYVLFHPFIDAAGIGTEQFKPGTYPDRQFIAKNCRPVSWAKVMERTGLSSVAAVDVGLRTSILVLKEEFSNREFAAKLEALVESSKILLPDEGRFSDLLHDQVLSSIQLLGYEWVWVGDEFGTERKLYWIDDLKNQQAGPTVGHCNVFTPDKAFLWTTHWDSHFSFLCSSESTLNAVQDAYHFEGFFCDRTTEVYWSVRP
ncbi:MAG: DUF2711 domain-containing protein [Acidobacteriota bacterium]|nr:DUF2711 domain-containing protein [Acidobacteriota bacterium]